MKFIPIDKLIEISKMTPEEIFLAGTRHGLNLAMHLCLDEEEELHDDQGTDMISEGASICANLIADTIRELDNEC